MVSFLLRKDSFYLITITITLVFNYNLFDRRHCTFNSWYHFDVILSGEGFATAYGSAIFDYVPDPSDAINFDYDVASSYSNKSTSRGTTQTSAIIPTHRNKTFADDDDEIDNNDQHNDVSRCYY